MRSTPCRQQGLVLVAVMVVVALAAMLAATLLFRIRAENAAAAAGTRGHQAYAAAMSGIHTAIALLKEAADDPQKWIDNPELFHNRLVVDDGADRWCFTVYAAPDDAGSSSGSEGVRFGLRDEASMINVNTAPASVLLALPGMTAPMVDALLDYIDTDVTPRPDGAEQEFYSDLRTPYLVRNGPLRTIDELLLIRGFDAKTVYGEDTNLNGRLDPNEDDGDAAPPDDNADGALDRGLRSELTVWSTEPDVDRQGKPRIDINAGADALSAADTGLSSETIKFIQTCRADGVTFTDPSQLLEMRHTPRTRGRSTSGRGGRGNPSSQPADSQAQEIESGVGSAELAIVLDKLTVGSTGKRVGRVNVNTAPASVLACLPGIDTNLARQIVDARAGLDEDTLRTPAWLVAQSILTAEQFKAVAPLLTARSYQFRVRCVGFGWPSGRYRALEAVVDVSGPGRIAYLRDITRAGPAVSMDPEPGRSTSEVP
jgi:type II secretory pathway component PulK